MTLIACLAADNYPVLIADGLTSSFKGRPDIRLPTIGDRHYQLQDTSKLKVHGTIEKLVRIGKNAIVAWAGDCQLATRLLKGISDLFGEEVAVSEAYILAYFEANYPNLIEENKVSFIFLVQENDKTKLRTFNCWRKENVGKLGRVVVAGTGLQDFFDYLEKFEPILPPIADRGQEVIGTAMTIVSALLADEVVTGRPTQKGFGAIYEIGGIFGGIVTKVDDFCCVVWAAERKNGGVFLSPRKILRSYSIEGLFHFYSGSLGGENIPELTEESIYVTAPLLNEDMVYTKKFIAPDLNAKFQANVFWPLASNPPLKLGVFLEHMNSCENHILHFYNETKILKIGFNNEKLTAILASMNEGGG